MPKSSPRCMIDIVFRNGAKTVIASLEQREIVEQMIQHRIDHGNKCIVFNKCDTADVIDLEDYSTAIILIDSVAFIAVSNPPVENRIHTVSNMGIVKA